MVVQSQNARKKGGLASKLLKIKLLAIENDCAEHFLSQVKNDRLFS